MKFNVESIARQIPGFHGQLAKVAVADGQDRTRPSPEIQLKNFPGRLFVTNVPHFVVLGYVDSVAGGWAAYVEWHLLGKNGRFPCTRNEPAHGIGATATPDIFEDRAAAETFAKDCEAAVRQQIKEWLS